MNLVVNESAYIFSPGCSLTVPLASISFYVSFAAVKHFRAGVVLFVVVGRICQLQKEDYSGSCSLHYYPTGMYALEFLEPSAADVGSISIRIDLRLDCGIQVFLCGAAHSLVSLDCIGTSSRGTTLRTTQPSAPWSVLATTLITLMASSVLDGGSIVWKGCQIPPGTGSSKKYGDRPGVRTNICGREVQLPALKFTHDMVIEHCCTIDSCYT